MGIPSNSQGQAILERTHQNIKVQYQILKSSSHYICLLNFFFDFLGQGFSESPWLSWNSLWTLEQFIIVTAIIETYCKCGCASDVPLSTTDDLATEVLIFAFSLVTPTFLLCRIPVPCPSSFKGYLKKLSNCDIQYPYVNSCRFLHTLDAPVFSSCVCDF